MDECKPLICGGQAKRTNIAIALITNPSVLFLAGLFAYFYDKVRETT